MGFLPLLILSSILILLVRSEPKHNSSYSLTKKETSHWCTAEGCKSCKGNSCEITCKGFSCGECPNGSCCNSKNCNACYDSGCCFTPRCNFCLRTCRYACNATKTCQHFCIEQCQRINNDVIVIPSKTKTESQKVTVYIKGVPYKGHVTAGQIKTTNETAQISLNGTKYSGTVLVLPTETPEKQNDATLKITKFNKSPMKREACCKGDTCDFCSSQCNMKCISQFCCSVCSKKCKPIKTTEEDRTQNGTSTVIQTTTGKIRRFDATTVINITNYVNSTQKHRVPIDIVSNSDQNYLENQYKLSCCHIVHPQQCIGTQVYPYRYCFRRNHQECSNLCTSKFVHFVQQEKSMEGWNRNQCYYIQSYPYVYCGQFTLKNCDSCYVCNGQYNPELCMKHGNCSRVCKETMSLVLPVNVNRNRNLYNVYGSFPTNHYQPQNMIRAIYPGTPEYEQILKLLRVRGEYVEDSF